MPSTEELRALDPWRCAARALLQTALTDALAALDPAKLVRAALPPLPPKRARVRVIAAGKAALAMTRGALDAWPDRIDDALVITTDQAADVATGELDPRVRVMRASHPLPDARSEAAAREALARAEPLGPSDLLLALISGGASALLALPPEGVTLEDKRSLVDALLASGASIRDVNVVRRHASRIKGGRLALAAAPARTLTLIVSDVIGGAPHDIGSGPSVPDPTTVADAANALRLFAPGAKIQLSESLAETTPGIRTRARIVADPTSLADHVASRLRDRGFVVRVDPADELSIEETVRARVATASSLAPLHAVVIPCEPRIQLGAERGSGGRAGHVALAAARLLPCGVMLMCAASDARDGSSGSAGALISREDLDGIEADRVADALSRLDDAALHRELRTTLDLGATRTNLADVHVIARGRA